MKSKNLLIIIAQSFNPLSIFFTSPTFFEPIQRLLKISNLHRDLYCFRNSHKTIISSKFSRELIKTHKDDHQHNNNQTITRTLQTDHSGNQTVTRASSYKTNRQTPYFKQN